MKITRTSMMSGIERTREIDVTVEQLAAWQDFGILIQDAMPHLSESDREFLMTGMTDEEWDSAFERAEDEYEY